MKRKIIAGLALACCMSLTACASVPSTPPPTSTLTELSLRADQTLYVAEAAYAAALTGIQAATNAGAIKGERAAKVLSLIDNADKLRRTAEAASVMGDAVTTQSSAVMVISLAGQIQTLLAAK